MSSDIDVAIPPFGNPTTAGVRANFAAAKSEIEELQTNYGFVDYNDSATSVTPISLLADTWTKLTNNTLGPYTKDDQLPAGVTRIWNAITNQFVFDELPLNTTIYGRFDIEITTSVLDSVVDLIAVVGVGSTSEFEVPLMTSAFFTTSGVKKIAPFNGMYIGSNDIKNYPTEIRIRSTSACTVKVNGWYVTIQLPGNK